MPTELTILLPAYEEAENLNHLLPALHTALQKLCVPYEILVIDAAERRDATPEICKTHNAAHIRRRGGSQYGHAIRTGIEEAKGRYTICMDADGSHNPDFIAKLWE